MPGTWPRIKRRIQAADVEGIVAERAQAHTRQRAGAHGGVVFDSRGHHLRIVGADIHSALSGVFLALEEARIALGIEDGRAG
ncbi:MAG: hypothetical protein IPG64_14120 [Haliea sp.]|nr:hypothetical protein [Haliea sp.]